FLIEDTLKSVMNQTYNNWEAVIVDDGSSDNTLQIIKQYSQKDKRFKLIRREEKKKGAPVCRNIGVKNARGEYIIFLDSDDLLAPYCLDQRYKEINQCSDFDFWIFPMLTFYSTPGDSKILWNIE